MTHPSRPATVEVRDTRGGNWFWAHNCLLDDYVAPGLLTPGEALVYLALCRLARDGRVDKGVPAIAALAGAKDRFTRSALAKLDGLGLIGIERRSDPVAGQLPNVYTLKPPPALRTGGDALSDTTPLYSGQGPGSSSAPLNKTDVKEDPQDDGETHAAWLAELRRRYRAGEPLDDFEVQQLRADPVGRAELKK